MKAMTAKRRHPRFVARQSVELLAEDRNDLRQVWVADISKGGLFVETDDPPPLRSKLQVAIQTPDGVIRLSAEVVHVLDTDTATAAGAKPGVGLQFVDLDADYRTAIEAYVEGLSQTLTEVTEPPPPPTDQKAVMAVIKRVMQGFEDEDLYAALGMPPLASTREIEVRVGEVIRLLNGATDALGAAQATRASHVQHLVRKASALLLHPDRRLDYDLRHGHIYPRERLAVADENERQLMRQAWHRNNPDALAMAEKHANLAARYEGVMKYKDAVVQAEKALEFDPFNPELWAALDTWQERLRLSEQPLEAPSETRPSNQTRANETDGS